MSNIRKILQPTAMHGREDGCVIVTEDKDAEIELHIVGRDATRLASVLLPNLDVQSLILIRNKIAADIVRRT